MRAQQFIICLILFAVSTFASAAKQVLTVEQDVANGVSEGKAYAKKILMYKYTSKHDYNSEIENYRSLCGSSMEQSIQLQKDSNNLKIKFADAHPKNDVYVSTDEGMEKHRRAMCKETTDALEKEQSDSAERKKTMDAQGPEAAAKMLETLKALGVDQNSLTAKKTLEDLEHNKPSPHQ